MGDAESMSPEEIMAMIAEEFEKKEGRPPTEKETEAFFRMIAEQQHDADESDDEDEDFVGPPRPGADGDESDGEDEDFIGPPRPGADGGESSTAGSAKRRRGHQPPLNSTYVMQRMPMQPLRPALPYKRRRRRRQQQRGTAGGAGAGGGMTALEAEVRRAGGHMVVVRALVPASTPEEQRGAEWVLRQLSAGPVKVSTQPLEEGLGVSVGPFILERSGRQVSSEKTRKRRFQIPTSSLDLFRSLVQAFW